MASDHPQGPASDLPSKPKFQQKQRISHTKSRGGCYACKNRHVKCDEARPVCGACSVRLDECVFPDPITTRASTRRGAAPYARASSSCPQSSQGLQIRPLDFNASFVETAQPHGVKGSLNLQDLRLLQHYILHTSKWITLSPDKSLVWERVIPDIASGAEYLMHLLLALAGLDMLTAHSKNPSLNEDNGSLTQVVISHHQKGLEGFQQEIQSHQESNSENLLTGAFLINLFAFASLQVGDMAPEDTWRPYVPTDSSHGAQKTPEWPRFQWLNLVRVSFSIGKQYWMHLQRSRMRSLLVFNKANDDWKHFIADLTPSPPVDLSQGAISARFSVFSLNAAQAICDLRAFLSTLKAAITPHSDDDNSRFSATPDSSSGAMKQTYCQDQDAAIEVVETMFMRILHVLSLHRTGAQSSPELEIQSEIEDAGIASWPTLVESGFISSLDLTIPFDSVQGLSLAILAHLYLTLALLDKIWIFGATFDSEIRKIATLINQSGNDGVVALMKWPMLVVEQPHSKV